MESSSASSIEHEGSNGKSAGGEAGNTVGKPAGSGFMSVGR
jgi:hypothetical protein